MTSFTFCFSNSLMPDIYKIDLSYTDPEQLAQDVNNSNDEFIPSGFKLEWSLECSDVRHKQLLTIINNKYPDSNIGKGYYKLTKLQLLDVELTAEVVNKLSIADKV